MGKDSGHVLIEIAEMLDDGDNAAEQVARDFIVNAELGCLLNSAANDVPRSSKRRKLTNVEDTRPSLTDLLASIYAIAKKLSLNFVARCRDWSDVMSLLSHSDLTVRWYAICILQLILQLSDGFVHQFVDGYPDAEDFTNLKLQLAEGTSVDSRNSPNKKSHVPLLALFANSVNVCGIRLRRHGLVDDSHQKMPVGFVMVSSVEDFVVSVALAVRSSKPVLITGPVGSGKSLLVQWLAAELGRSKPPEFIKIQLGEQMDGKSLLGQYMCTSVPSEFFWTPGPLLEAVTKGYWVLLEDLDCAAVDVLTCLCSLLENRSISVSGRGVFQAHPDFQLFATIRTDNNEMFTGLRDRSKAFIIEKPWISVHLKGLSKADLTTILHTRYPKLQNFFSRLLDLFDSIVGNYSEESKLLQNRLPTTRDFFKFCNRLERLDHFSDSGIVFAEAYDCFAASASNSDQRLSIALCIAAKLNLNREHVDYYCNTYKPDVVITESSFRCGRTVLGRMNSYAITEKETFALTRPALCLLESLCGCIVNREPVLLVGETGCGKTATVQFLAKYIGCSLVVVNMSQQSEAADLVGGIKPVDLKQIMSPVMETYLSLFGNSYDTNKNAKFLSHIEVCFVRSLWDELIFLMRQTAVKAVEKNRFLTEWSSLLGHLDKLDKAVKHNPGAMAFSFVEGVLVKAMKTGAWILLDELNLAPPEMLDCLCSLFDAFDSNSFVVLNSGEMETVTVHPQFRLFACMNPATDVGKRNLQTGTRNRFTEFFVDEVVSPEDLRLLTLSYVDVLSPSVAQVSSIVDFYRHIRAVSHSLSSDALGHSPHFCLRTFCRALKCARENLFGNVSRSLYEAFCLSFLTELDFASYEIVQRLVSEYIISKNVGVIKSVLGQPVPSPKAGNFKMVEGYWIECGQLSCENDPYYCLTSTVKRNLADLARAISYRKCPILLQGETSVGKTSLIKFVASLTGNVCVRINNHEHTDLQEYVGSYSTNESGKLAFVDGPLVQAMRKGHWVILDELNLAPSDVLEALNRLLDDNRELLVPETQETVKPHPNFILFATQNPPGLYGGRKFLSKAFRSRFIELNFNELPFQELGQILEQRCQLPMSYAKKMVQTMHDLQVHRSMGGVFAGKESYMTLRDLFRWGERYQHYSVSADYFDWDQYLADQGYMLLGGRARREDDANRIQEVIQKRFNRTIDVHKLFSIHSPYFVLPLKEVITGFEHIVWTSNICRLAVLIGQGLKYGEPLLLVGETGCGKTTMCQLFAKLNGVTLHSVNCHLMTEAADFLGRLRPADSQSLEKGVLFEWSDGVLIHAMTSGEPLLIDEISLADDSVLERLNSVLEPGRTLLLAERVSTVGSSDSVLKAKDGFSILATMNPGGDYGKKELSKALRNRFTEVWCDANYRASDLVDIIEHNIIRGINIDNQSTTLSGFGSAIVEFASWIEQNGLFFKRCFLTVRDIMAWVRFMNKCSSIIPPTLAYAHGACLAIVDSIDSTDSDLRSFRNQCSLFLKRQLLRHSNVDDLNLFNESCATASSTQQRFGIYPFFISMGHEAPKQMSYCLDSPTCSRNLFRILRAMQIDKPVLLEGSPGVGKSSLIMALAAAAGHKLTRINLSEQTDVGDLFGCDLPAVLPDGKPTFAWYDGPLLTALKEGHWILLDEMNLANQSVLESLNACFDHRGEIYIPELLKTFKVNSETTRFFACQNPFAQGGSRKGLPKSFVNRFSVVVLDPLESSDQLEILKRLFPSIQHCVLENMVVFNFKVAVAICENKEFGQKGSPWEFNLRDLMRWCELMITYNSHNPGEFFDLLYRCRMRTEEDRQKLEQLYYDHFAVGVPDTSACVLPNCSALCLTPDLFSIGTSFSLRNSVKSTINLGDSSIHLFQGFLRSLQNILTTNRMNWLTTLVGPAASGKSSLVKTLASLTGNKLAIVNLSTECDANELLGSFEQVTVEYAIGKCFSELLQCLEQKCVKFLKLREIKKCCAAFRYVHKLCNLQQTNTLDVKGILNVLDKIKGIGLKAKVGYFKEELTRLNALNKTVQFEWLNSQLLEALENGSWLLLKNVNHCNAAVLDRLNAFLEPGGVLTVTERGLVNGLLPSYSPHPNFRLFFTLDPAYGELSRAMRNRGIEIYLSPKEVWFTNDDVLRSIIQAMKLNPAVEAVLVKSYQCETTNHMAPYKLLQSCFITRQLICCGLSYSDAVSKACAQAFQSPFAFQSTSDLQGPSHSNGLSIFKVSEMCVDCTTFELRKFFLVMQMSKQKFFNCSISNSYFKRGLSLDEDSLFCSKIKDLISAAHIYSLESEELRNLFLDKHCTDIGYLPVDLRWNFIYKRLIYSMTAEHYNVRPVIFLWNKLVLHCVLNFIFDGYKLSRLSLTVDDINSPNDSFSCCFSKLVPELIALLKDTLSQLFGFASPVLISDACFEKMLIGLSYLKQYVCLLFSLDGEVDLLQILLYFFWLNKFLITEITALQKLPNKLWDAVSAIRASFQCNPEEHKRFYSSSSALVKVPPYISESQVVAITKYCNVINQLNVICSRQLLCLSQYLCSLTEIKKGLMCCHLNIDAIDRFHNQCDELSKEIYNNQCVAKTDSGSEAIVKLWSLTDCSLVPLQLLAVSLLELQRLDVERLSKFLLENCKSFPFALRLMLQEESSFNVILSCLDMLNHTYDFQHDSSDTFNSSRMLCLNLSKLWTTDGALFTLSDLDLELSLRERTVCFIWAQGSCLAASSVVSDFLDDSIKEWENKLMILPDSQVPLWRRFFNVGFSILVKLGVPGYVDPVKKTHIKHDLVMRQLEDVKCDIEILSTEHELFCGYKLNDSFGDCDNFHPYAKAALLHSRSLAVKETKLQSMLGYRPPHRQYLLLRSELNSMMELCENLKLRLSDFEASKSQQSLQSLLSWLRSASYVQRKLLLEFTAYPDIVCIYRMALNFLQLAVQLIVNQSQTSIPCCVNSVEQTERSKFVEYLLSYPPCRNYSNENCRKLTEALQQTLSTFDAFKYLKALFLGNSNVCLDLAYFACQWLYNAWQNEIRSSDSEKYYSYRAKTSGLTPEEQAEKEVREVFPDYTAEFSDPNASFESACLTGSSASEERAWTMEPSEIGELLCLIEGRLSKVSPCRSSSVKSQLLLFSLGQLVLQKWPDCSSTSVDGVLSCWLVWLMSRDCAPDRELRRGDLYFKSDNASEALACKEKLRVLRHAVDQLLDKWPEHPVLLDIQRSILRVLELRIGTPVMKMAAALEKLLYDSEQWQIVAAKHVSLENHLVPLRHLLISWRKLEILSWRNLLEDVESDSGTSAWPLFLDLFGLTQQYFAGLVFNEVVNSCKQLMEFSPLGQYSCRLKLLNFLGVFLSCNLDAPPEAVNDLHLTIDNLVRFYGLWSSAVDAHIKFKRSPVEKQLKEFIGIVKYSDLNFWSMKESAQKAHRQLFKFVKNYKDLLTEPVDEVRCQLLTLPAEPCKEAVAEFCVPLSSFPTCTSFVELGKHLPRMAQLCAVMSSRVKGFQTLVIDDTVELSTELDELARVLQSQVNYVGTEEEMMKQFRTTMNSRQTKVTDVLKSLKQEGLSFRKGQQLTTEQLEHRWLLTNHDVDFSSSEFFLAVQYLIAFCNALNKPNEQLRPDTSQKISGFGFFFLSEVMELRNSLVSGACSMKELIKFLQSLSLMCHDGESKRRLPSQTDGFVLLSKVKEYLLNSSNLLCDTIRLWQCCPGGDLCDTYQVLPSTVCPLLASFKKESPEFCRLYIMLENIANSIDNAVKSMPEEKHYADWTSLYFVESLARSVVNENMSLLEELITGSSINQKPTLFSHALISVREIFYKLTECCDNAQRSFEHLPVSPSTTEKAKMLADSISSKTLLCIQKFHNISTSAVNFDESIIKYCALLKQLLHTASTSEISKALKKLFDLSVTKTIAFEDCSVLLELLRCILPMMDVYAAFIQYLLDSTKQFLAHLEYCVLKYLNAFIVLVKNGYVNLPPQDLVNTDKLQKSKRDEGMGLGSGEGQKDVTDEIEDESQVEGLRGDQDSSSPQPLDSSSQPVEMDDMLGGDLEDVKLDEADESNEDTDSKDEDLNEDWETGSVGDPEETQLDPELWEDKENINSEKPALDDDSQGANKEQENLVAKDNANRPSPGNKDRDENQETGDGEDSLSTVSNEDAPGQQQQQQNEDRLEETQFDLENLALDQKELSESEEPALSEDGNNVSDAADREESCEDNSDAPEEECRPESTSIEPDDKPALLDDVVVSQHSAGGHTSLQEGGSNIDPLQHNDMQSKPEVQQSIEERMEVCEERKDSSDETALDGGDSLQTGENVGEGLMKQRTQTQSSMPENNTEKSSTKPNDSLKTLADVHDKSSMKPVQIEDMEQEQNEMHEEGLQSDLASHASDLRSELVAVDSAQLETAKKQNSSLLKDLRHNDKLDLENIRTQNDDKRKSDSNQTVDTLSRLNAEAARDEMNTENLSSPMDSSYDNTMASTIHTILSFYDKTLKSCRAAQPELLQIEQITSVSDVTDAENYKVWAAYQSLVQSPASELTENLRQILEPTLASKLQGDYRSGKRLNIRRLIPYIASNYRKNKIWLRRTMKCKRDYQVLMAIDNSSSMLDNQSKQMALEAVALMATALQQLDVGQLGICKFGETVTLLHALSNPFTSASGCRIIRDLQFNEKNTDISQMLQFVTSYYENTSSSNASSELPARLLLIISDGRGLFVNGMEPVQKAIQSALSQKVFMVYIILDSKKKDSIMDIKVPIFRGPNSIPEIKSYMDFFPFAFYIILRDIRELPAIVGDALRQWFELITTK